MSQATPPLCAPVAAEHGPRGLRPQSAISFKSFGTLVAVDKKTCSPRHRNQGEFFIDSFGRSRLRGDDACWRILAGRRGRDLPAHRDCIDVPSPQRRAAARKPAMLFPGRLESFRG